jgi:hypothetical protein
MIGVNRLRTEVLITTDEVIFHAPTDHQADPRTIENNIIIAERRFVKPILKGVLYQALIETKNKLVTAGNKVSLQTDVNTGRGADREAITLNEGDYVNSDTYLDVNQQALWKKHLHKIVAECVWLVALPVQRVRFVAGGVVKNYPESISENRTSVTADLPDLKHLMDKGLNERITVLIQDMYEYLCENSFSGFQKNCCDDESASSQKSSGVIFGLYDDDDKPKRSRWGIN